MPSPSFTRELLSVRVLMCIVLFLCLPIGRTVLPLNTGLKFRDRQVHHILTGGGPEFAALDLPQGKPERMWRCMISRVNNLNHGSEVERDGLDPICAFNASHALPRRVAVPFLSRTVELSGQKAFVHPPALVTSRHSEAVPQASGTGRIVWRSLTTVL